MRTDIERKFQWCLSRSVHMKEMKTKRAGGLTPFAPGIRFSAVAVDILGPVTMATSSRAKHVLVLTDFFTMYNIAVHLLSTDFSDVAREIVKIWVLKFGAPNVLHTDQGKRFGVKFIQEIWRLLGIDKTQTSPNKSKGNGQTERHNAKMVDVILIFCTQQRKRTTRDRSVPTEKNITGRKFTGNPMRVVTRSGCGHKRQVSQRSFLTCGKDHML